MNPITIQALVNAPIEKVWQFWNEPQHIMNWAFASEDWETPAAQNDLQVGGKFVTTMAAKDKSASFDFNGVYTNIIEHELIEYTIEGGRKVSITFKTTPEGVQVTETFDPENENSEEMQRAGWQAILNNFKKYVEAN
ncbi:MAG: SRPBCC family protein [Candidatus Magasanikbacteria bacterium]|nr:SRPBCC family protein [Candidatus Magasanikbacteria bacterium]